MVHRRVIDAHRSTDKDYINWKSRVGSAAVARERGSLADARTAMYRALIAAESLSDSDFAVPASQIGLAVIMTEQGDFKAASQEFEKGLSAAQAHDGQDFRELYAAGLRFRSMLHEAQSEFDEAERCLRRSVDLLKKNGPESSIQLAYSLCDLSFILVRLGKLAEAEELIKSAMRILKENLDRDHPQQDWAKLIYHLCRSSNDEEALLEAFEMSAVKFQYKVGAKHPNLVRALSAYAEELKKRGLADKIQQARAEFSSFLSDQ